MSGSSYRAGDGLSSGPARLVVRHPPGPPRVYREGGAGAVEGAVSLLAGQEEVLLCESRGGNPAPLLRWFLADRELTAVQVRRMLVLTVYMTLFQRNESGGGGPGPQWTAVSKLVRTFTPDEDGEVVVCQAEHAALAGRVRQVSIRIHPF